MCAGPHKLRRLHLRLGHSARWRRRGSVGAGWSGKGRAVGCGHGGERWPARGWGRQHGERGTGQRIVGEARTTGRGVLGSAVPSGTGAATLGEAHLGDNGTTERGDRERGDPGTGAPGRGATG